MLGARWKVGGEQEGDRRCAAPEGEGVPVLEVVGEVPVLPPRKYKNTFIGLFVTVTRVTGGWSVHVWKSSYDERGT